MGFGEDCRSRYELFADSHLMTSDKMYLEQTDRTSPCKFVKFSGQAGNNSEAASLTASADLLSRAKGASKECTQMLLVTCLLCSRSPYTPARTRTAAFGIRGKGPHVARSLPHPFGHAHAAVVHLCLAARLRGLTWHQPTPAERAGTASPQGRRRLPGGH